MVQSSQNDLLKAQNLAGIAAVNEILSFLYKLTLPTNGSGCFGLFMLLPQTLFAVEKMTKQLF